MLKENLLSLVENVVNLFKVNKYFLAAVLLCFFLNYNHHWSHYPKFT